jgi:hypothetical protein
MFSEAFENFKKSWLEEVTKIESRAIDSEGVYGIYLNFDRDRLSLEMNMSEDEMTSGISTEFDVIEAKLVVALETARSKFRLQNFGLWARIAEGIGGITHRIPKRQTPKTEPRGTH